jgi:uncharacterized BrkB/YihY/UPF0761 family membrane protein
MLWLYISALAVNMGAELNAELERQTTTDATVGAHSQRAGGAPPPPTHSARPPNQIRNAAPIQDADHQPRHASPGTAP